jgi:hypothetical protein
MSAGQFFGSCNGAYLHLVGAQQPLRWRLPVHIPHPVLVQGARGADPPPDNFNIGLRGPQELRHR